ncbi:hypothetical protein SAMN05216417_10229 [Nitrosospira multiformis]|uniref:Uncharacterized protein n=1 Tax=Nitrosospira multiformis TaxID=1231 RepID=A0A1I7FMR7_9PROT|nr:hypothetical protein SAMN05216417_10229 [Nitrosospira multiformis]
MCRPYEFGVKVSVVTTHKEGLVVGMQSLPGNPYDGHAACSPGTSEKPDKTAVEGSVRGPGRRFHALLCGCGHNLRMILRKLRLLLDLILVRLQAQTANDDRLGNQLIAACSQKSNCSGTTTYNDCCRAACHLYKQVKHQSLML